MEVQAAGTHRSANGTGSPAGRPTGFEPVPCRQGGQTPERGRGGLRRPVVGVRPRAVLPAPIVVVMATEVAPGIHRLGNEIVNFYVIEDGDGVTVADRPRKMPMIL